MRSETPLQGGLQLLKPILTKLSSGHRCALRTLLMWLFFGACSAMTLNYFAHQNSQALVQQRGHTALDANSKLLQTPLFNRDLISIQSILIDLVDSQDIISATLHDPDGIPLSTIEASNLDHDHRASLFQRTITLADSEAGVLTVGVDRTGIERRQYQSAWVWASLWLLFTVATSLFEYRRGTRLQQRITLLSSKLPGPQRTAGRDELDLLEERLQPLLTGLHDRDIDTSHGHYASLVSITLHNDSELSRQLSRENREQILERLDYCVLRTLELYGGSRIEGSSQQLRCYFHASQFSKQHLMICLMASWSLRELLSRLSRQSGVELAISFAIHSRFIRAGGKTLQDQQLGRIKEQAQLKSRYLASDDIVIHSEEMDIEQLATLGHFVPHEQGGALLQGFSQQRTELLQTQFQHLCRICLEPSPELARP